MINLHSPLLSTPSLSLSLTPPQFSLVCFFFPNLQLFKTKIHHQIPKKQNRMAYFLTLSTKQQVGHDLATFQDGAQSSNLNCVLAHLNLLFNFSCFLTIAPACFLFPYFFNFLLYTPYRSSFPQLLQQAYTLK